MNNKIKALTEKQSYSFNDLVEIMNILRSPDGCPWDREQTHRSIRQNFIEETYEAVEAIDNGDSELLCEELGDVMLQVVFHSKMADEGGDFSIDDVVEGICKKLIVRHPHIFSDVKADTSEKVLENWDDIKRKTKKHKSTAETMDSISKALPALMRAEKIGKKAKKVGFDFPDAKSAADKLREELDEVLAADENEVEGEIGDLLFAVVNLSRLCGVEPESALSAASDKFTRRFTSVEKAAESAGGLVNMTLCEADKLWDKVKADERNGRA
ncbi:MAG: nucleoside triphosphate pyrophosphohydrolase [Eubacteriales bacterium]|nr:nucleoside triphosphate pyrophosphohydrolase [Eubacteriales bacterium]